MTNVDATWKFPAKVHCSGGVLQVKTLPVDSLSVPVVDLVDVPEHNLVFSFHVFWDALLLDPLHVALQYGQFRVQFHIKPKPSTWSRLAIAVTDWSETKTANVVPTSTTMPRSLT